MEDAFINRVPRLSKSFSQRLLDYCFRAKTCRCIEGAACLDKDCSCSRNEMCAVRDWAENDSGVERPDRPTLNVVQVGEKASIEQIFLPLAQKKRLLSLGLTYGTEIAVINNENGRMIIAVRDSRLGLSPEVASRITFKSA